tara:strand:+ start:2182 stop:3042 length:861 start_codon:yes stop_codon:yes gene_type:complete
MPELPEVEIVKQSLNKVIKSKTINKILVNNRNLRFKVPLDFEKFLKKKIVIKTSRRSKYVIFELNNKTYFLIHLGMSGTLHLVYKNYNLNTNLSFYKNKNLPGKHNHLIFFFKKFKIIYNDPRRFGFVKIIKNKQEMLNYFSKLGPEPFSNSFNEKYLKSKFKNSIKNIKTFLLDQTLVSGIGNIYASEILFRSKINPLKQVKNLTQKELQRIILSTKFVLNYAINKGGSSIRDFKNILGSKGNYQKEFKVYERQNSICQIKGCKSKITKINISKRATYYCKKCQK